MLNIERIANNIMKNKPLVFILQITHAVLMKGQEYRYLQTKTYFSCGCH